MIYRIEILNKDTSQKTSKGTYSEDKKDRFRKAPAGILLIRL